MKRQGFTAHASPVVLLAASLTLLACSADDDPTTGGAGPPRDAAVQVVNGTPARVSVRVDGQLAIPGLAPGSVSEPLGLARGAHTVELETSAMRRATGVQLDEGQMRVVAAFGTLDSLDAQVLDDTTFVPAPGTVKLRIVHMAAGAPSITVWRTQPDANGPLSVMCPFVYGSGAEGFFQGDPGDWRVWVASGTLTPPPSPGGSITCEGDPAPELASTGAIRLAAGDVRTVVLLRDGDGRLRFEMLAARP